jgi:hypothetical protein
MGDLIQWIAALGMAGIGVMFLVEVRRWRLMGPMMGRGQKILRVLLIAFIEVLFVLMLVGPAVTARKDPFTSLLFWTACLVLGLTVVALALLDLRIVVRQYARMSREVFRDLRGDDRREQ